MSDGDNGLERVQRERDLYRRERDLYGRLLDLGTEHDVERFLREALALAVDATEARQGYLEVYAASGDDGASWSTGHALEATEVDNVRAAVSRGIIAEAVATGKTVVTDSALTDPRFAALASVRGGRIGSVLCAPIGDDHPRGVVYLQNRLGHGRFTEDDRQAAERLARRLAPLVDGVLQRARARASADATAAVRQRLRAEGIVGASAALAAVLEQAALVAPLDVNVLLTGESGTGKSQLARVIHDNGPRAGHPFVELNCAALPEALVESELFGALPGAHSTATRRVEGKVDAAEHGTLFLDEIGELALPAQAKLLQLLQSKTFYPLGSARPMKADVRVIAASNSDLEARVRERQFREDLFYRLQVLPIRMPTLAERREDIALLAAHCCDAACARLRVPRLTLSPGAVRACEAAEWPGNVRQLEHAVEAAVIRATGAGARQLETAHLFPGAVGGPPGSPTTETFQEATRRFQAALLRDALEANGWNVVETARRLDLARSHVYTLIRAFGLDRERR